MPDIPNTPIDELREAYKQYLHDQDYNTVIDGKNYEQLFLEKLKSICAAAEKRGEARGRIDEEHWYAGTFGRDENGFEVGHRCRCGLKSTSKEVITSHVKWKLATLTKATPAPEDSDE